MATSVGEPVHFSLPSSHFSSAPLLRTPQSAICWHFSVYSLGNCPDAVSRTETCRPSCPILSALTGMARSWTSISPLVRVPVLSEQKTETQPKVSTASIFRTRTFFRDIWSEAIISEIVTVGRRPSGTCAKSAAALFCRMSAGVRFTSEARLAARERPPTTMATTAMMCTKCSIWISRVDFTRDDLMPWAILPRNVASPVACTTQVALPFRITVPKKARLRASVGEHDTASVLGWRGSGMDSPVSAELSTSMPSVQYRMRTSAGMRSPASRKMMSPGTRLIGSSIWSRRSPLALRRTVGTGLADAIFCRASIWSSACCSACHCSNAAITMTMERMMGVTRSPSSSPVSSSPVSVEAAAVILEL
mmetsp:Transcript_27009/g.80469  ORF Transcript_27009/g.80469 Transcript_27009/m.80469 type:complete len:363 (+) Transcript_27009:1186-2274(+)